MIHAQLLGNELVNGWKTSRFWRSDYHNGSCSMVILFPFLSYSNFSFWCLVVVFPRVQIPSGYCPEFTLSRCVLWVNLIPGKGAP